MVKRISRLSLVLASIAAVVMAACGSDEPTEGSTSGPAAGSAAPAAPVANACPTDGCVITIVDVAKKGDEIAVTWEANFEPDVSKNHIHVYWDTFSADQVSERRRGARGGAGRVGPDRRRADLRHRVGRLGRHAEKARPPSASRRATGITP